MAISGELRTVDIGELWQDGDYLFYKEGPIKQYFYIIQRASNYPRTWQVALRLYDDSHNIIVTGLIFSNESVRWDSDNVLNIPSYVDHDSNNGSGKFYIREILQYAFTNRADLGTAINYAQLGSIEKLVIPKTVWSIGWGAFQGCTGLIKLTLPFVGQKALTSTSGSYLYRIGYIFGTSAGSASDVQAALPENLETITVNQGTAFLADQAFAFANKVKKIQIVLANAVQAFCFGRAAFYGCSALETFAIMTTSGQVDDEGKPVYTVPTLNTLDCLSDSIFANCTTLKNITLPHTKAFATSAYEALQISTDPVAVDADAPGLPATLIGKGQTPDYNIFLQITPPTDIVITNFSIDGLYGNVTINGQTTLKWLASMSSIKTNYEKQTNHQYETLSAFVNALSSVLLLNYSTVLPLQTNYSLALSFNDGGPYAEIEVSAPTCGAVEVLEKDQSNNYPKSTKIAYNSGHFLEKIDQVWRPLPLTAMPSLTDNDTEINHSVYSIQTIGQYFFAGTSKSLGDGTVSLTAPQKLIHTFIQGTNRNNSRLQSIVFSRTDDEYEVGGFWECGALDSASYESIYDQDTTALADYAFSQCSSLKGFSSNYITSIGYAAFQLCSSLTTVQLKNATNLVARKRFSGDGTWGDSQSAVGSSLAFYNCENLKTLQLAFAEITEIGDYALSGCTKLSWGERVSPTWSKLESIGYHAFLNCRTLTTIGDLNSVQNIYFGAFQGCTSLTSITVPQVYTQVNISEVRIPKYDNFGAFFGASSYQSNSSYVPTTLETVVIKGGKNIGFSAFRDCAHLTSITIPNSVESIGDYAFSGCTGLAPISIPESVESIGLAAFYGCTGFTGITLPFVGATKDGTSNTHFGYIFGASSHSYNDDYVPTTLKTVVITSGSSIGDSAFSGCVNITSVTIPDSVTSIGDEAFYDCAGLQQVAFGDESELTSIGNYAFSGCSSLTTIEIPDGVTSIEDHTFYNCSKLNQINIPNNVTSIGSSAFDGCASLKDITIPNKVTIIYSCAFYNCINLQQVTFVDMSLLISIGDYAFSGCSRLTSITIPDSVTRIGDSAFSNCTSLTSVTFGENSQLTSIGSSAFINCTSLGYDADLESVLPIEIPNSVTSIGDSAFAYCGSLTSITFGANSTLESIGSNAFYDCTNLKSVQIVNLTAWCRISFNGVYSNPLYYAKKLYLNGALVTNLVIPDSVTSIGSYAFYNCDSLTSITIPNSVTSIGDSAFYNCAGLTSLQLQKRGGELNVGNWAFCKDDNGNKISLWTTETPQVKVQDLQSYALLGFSESQSSFCYGGGKKLINAKTNQPYSSFYLGPDGGYVGAYAFYNWGSADAPVQVFVFKPETAAGHAIGTAALAINGILYWYGPQTDNVFADEETTKVCNFGLNNWQGTLPQSNGIKAKWTGVAKWLDGLQAMYSGKFADDNSTLGFTSLTRYTNGLLALSDQDNSMLRAYGGREVEWTSDNATIGLSADTDADIRLTSQSPKIALLTGDTKLCPRLLCDNYPVDSEKKFPHARWIALVNRGEADLAVMLKSEPSYTAKYNSSYKKLLKIAVPEVGNSATDPFTIEPNSAIIFTKQVQ